MIASLKKHIESVSLRRKYGYAVGMGLVAAAAMPPLGFWPILFLIFPCLWLMLQSCMTTRQIFGMMWLFSLGYFTAGLYWIAAALFVDIAHNWWVLPFALLGLPALMGFYPAAAAALWHRLAWQGPARVLLLVVLLALSEAARGICFTGFPWNVWGYAWMDALSVMQSTAWWGIYGLSLFTLLLAFLPVLWAQQKGRLGTRLFVGAIALIAVCVISYGQGRLATHFSPQPQQMRVRIVQPNIPQEMKWDAKQREEHEKTLWQLTAQPAALPPHVVVWPETAITLIGTDDVRHLEERIQQILPGPTLLAAGILDVGWNAQTAQPIFYNRISFYDTHAQRLGFYDKSHLVPFGEYLPFQEYWPVRPVAFQAGRFSAGSGAQTLALAHLPRVSPLICYEVLFPGDVIDKAERPAWMLNVTNDAWYGRTSGPYQHLAIARTRAIEEGVPLVRAANTGISAMIDPMGRIVDMLPLNTQGIIDASLPPALQPTFFARHGNTTFYILCAGLLAVAGLWQLEQRKRIPHV